MVSKFKLPGKADGKVLVSYIAEPHAAHVTFRLRLMDKELQPLSGQTNAKPLQIPKGALSALEKPGAKNIWVIDLNIFDGNIGQTYSIQPKELEGVNAYLRLVFLKATVEVLGLNGLMTTEFASQNTKDQLGSLGVISGYALLKDNLMPKLEKAIADAAKALGI